MVLRKILAVIIVLSLSVSLCSCKSSPPTKNTNSTSYFEDTFADLSSAFFKKLKENQENQEKFGSLVLLSSIVMSDGLKQYILYDSQTMVMYSYIESDQCGVITKLFNTDGTLRLYSPESENETK